jgi:hypothetical protein
MIPNCLSCFIEQSELRERDRRPSALMQPCKVAAKLERSSLAPSQSAQVCVIDNNDLHPNCL